MDLKQLFHDDDAVSPVIGVILMVAITVILAAVIASFVLGLGDSADEVAPDIAFESDYNESAGNVTLSVVSASDTPEAQSIIVRGDIDDDGESWNDLNETSEPSASDTLSAGSSAVVTGVGDGDEVRIVYETEDTSDTLRTFEY